MYGIGKHRTFTSNDGMILKFCPRKAEEVVQDFDPQDRPWKLQQLADPKQRRMVFSALVSTKQRKTYAEVGRGQHTLKLANGGAACHTFLPWEWFGCGHRWLSFPRGQSELPLLRNKNAWNRKKPGGVRSNMCTLNDETSQGRKLIKGIQFYTLDPLNHHSLPLWGLCEAWCYRGTCFFSPFFSPKPSMFRNHETEFLHLAGVYPTCCFWIILAPAIIISLDPMAWILAGRDQRDESSLWSHWFWRPGLQPVEVREGWIQTSVEYGDVGTFEILYRFPTCPVSICASIVFFRDALCLKRISISGCNEPLRLRPW